MDDKEIPYFLKEAVKIYGEKITISELEEKIESGEIRVGEK